MVIHELAQKQTRMAIMTLNFPTVTNAIFHPMVCVMVSLKLS